MRITHASCVQILNGTSWVPWALLNYQRANDMVKAWDTLFQASGEFGDCPERVQGSITSEFFVSRNRCPTLNCVGAMKALDMKLQQMPHLSAFGAMNA